MSCSILIVEDEPAILEGLCELLQQSGFQTTPVDDGQRALEMARTGDFDAIILDVMLPNLDGISVLKEVRAGGDRVPILLLTAKGAEDDIVVGLEAGADDYMTKPFGTRELVARVRGLMRRAVPPADDTADARSEQVGDTEIDFRALEVRWPTGTLSLTPRESQLLRYLADHKERPVSREELLTEVWGYASGNIRTRTVDVHIQQLRAKLATIPHCAELIRTVRGMGYRYGVAPG